MEENRQEKDLQTGKQALTTVDEHIFFKELVDKMPVGLYTASYETESVTWCNQYMENMFGLSANEIIALGSDFCGTLVHPDDQHLTQISQLLLSQQPLVNFGGVFRVRSANDANWKWLAGWATSLQKDNSGIATDMLCVLVDLGVCIHTYDRTIDALKDALRNKKDETLLSLTNREREVLLLIAKGLKNKEVAERLSLSEYTIETHRKNIKLKLNVRTTTELLKKAEDLVLLNV
ncbi:Oxygen regulatory protein NreC [compost metagenome]